MKLNLTEQQALEFVEKVCNISPYGKRLLKFPHTFEETNGSIVLCFITSTKREYEDWAEFNFKDTRCKYIPKANFHPDVVLNLTDEFNEFMSGVTV